MDTPSWFRTLALRFREELAALPVSAAAKVQHIADLRPPCQAQIFELADPPCQFILVAHSRTSPDLTVSAFVLQPWEILDVLEAALKDPLWDDEYVQLPRMVPPPDPDATLRTVGEDLLLRANSWLRNAALRQPENMGSTSFSMAVGVSRCSTWTHFGPLKSIDVDEFMRHHLPPPRIDPQPTNAVVTTTARSPQEIFSGYGAFIFPRIKIGRPSRRGIRSRLNEEYEMPGETVLVEHLGPYPCRLTHQGFVALETKDKHAALHWLNLFVAALLGDGIYRQVFRLHDIGGIHFPESDSQPYWGGEYPNYKPPGNDPFDVDLLWLKVPEVVGALRTAEKLALLRFGGEIPLLLEAHTLLDDMQPTPSFVFSWAVLERVVADLWAQFLDVQQITGKRREKFLNNATWTFDIVVESLALGGQVPRALANDLDRIRRVRNAVLHGSRQATIPEATDALAIAETLLIGDGPRIIAPRRPPRWKIGMDL